MYEITEKEQKVFDDYIKRLTKNNTDKFIKEKKYFKGNEATNKMYLNFKPIDEDPKQLEAYREYMYNFHYTVYKSNIMPIIKQVYQQTGDLSPYMEDK